MKSLSLSLLLALLLVHVAPAGVAAQAPLPSLPQKVAHLEDLLIFTASRGLWRTDGTAAGTFHLAKTCSSDYSCSPIVGQAGGRIFFLVEAPELKTEYGGSRYQLWATDGSRTGTHQLAVFPRGLPAFTMFDDGAYWVDGSYLPAPGLGLFFFRGITPATGAELWVSDGTPAGTRMVVELSPGPADGVHRILSEVAGRILFAGVTPEQGVELWRSDGTVGGTTLLREFAPGPAKSTPRAVTSLDGRTFFTFGVPDLSHELWVSDGTVGGTRLLYALERPPLDTWIRWWEGVTAESQVFLTVTDTFTLNKDGLTITSAFMRSDGTTVGTYRLCKLYNVFLPLTAFGDSVLFGGGDAEPRSELWISDGTPGDCRLVADLEPVLGTRRIFGELVVAGSLCYFLTTDTSQSQFEAWLTDGSEAGTHPFLSFSGNTYFPSLTHGPQDQLFFVESNAGNPRTQALWVTPAVAGSAGSTTRLLRPSSMQIVLDNAGIVGGPVGDVFLFVARDQNLGIFLWRSDGTSAGTFPLTVLALAPPELPGRISRLIARPEEPGSGLVTLTWDPANRAHFYELETKTPAAGNYWAQWGPVAEERTTLYLHPGDPFAVRLRGVNDFGTGPWTETTFTLLPAPVTPCVPGRESLCLHDSRFEVKAYYEDHIHGGWGAAQAAPMSFSDDSGAFWFFTPNNLELTIKVLDARVVNGYFWSFFGGLTTLETWISITDTEAQTNVTFHKNANEMCGRADVAAFPRPAFEALGVGGTCEPGPDHLCLTGNRYRVEVTWRDQRSGHTGVGHALPGTEDSGFFWFFDDENVELLVKVLDARTVNGYTWVFSGSMTDVEYTLTVTDTLTGQRKQYYNPPGTLCGGQADVAAF